MAQSGRRHPLRAGTFDDPEAFERLSATVQELDRDRGTQGNHAFYMSVPPRAFPQVAKQLAASGLSRSSEAHGAA